MVDMLGTKVCDYCIHNKNCVGSVVCYGGNPIEPPCGISEYEEILDVDAIREYLEENSNDERDVRYG